jgi:hypothetical protein
MSQKVPSLPFYLVPYLFFSFLPSGNIPLMSTILFYNNIFSPQNWSICPHPPPPHPLSMVVRSRGGGGEGEGEKEGKLFPPGP